MEDKMKSLFSLFVLIIVFTTGEVFGDIPLSNYEPLGEVTGIKANDGNLYVAINDTQTVDNHGLIILKSGNNGMTWSSPVLSLSPPAKLYDLKFLNLGDSLVLAMRYNNYIWFVNVHSQSIYYMTTNAVKSFDIISSSTNSVYVFYQDMNNTLYRRNSTDNGRTWSSQVFLSNDAGYPEVAKSPYGDTLFLAYRHTLGTNLETSGIRSYRFRETSPGVLPSIGAFSQIFGPGIIIRSEFKPIIMGNKVYLFYTEKSLYTDYTNIYCLASNDGGINYTSIIYVAVNSDKSTYWFDVKPGTGFHQMVNVVYYQDIDQVGPPTNQTDKLVYKGISHSNPFDIITDTPFAEHPPQWSPRNYKPVVIEMPGEEQLGILWVGLHGSNKKRVYFDSRYIVDPPGLPFDNITDSPADYELKQNYPNPFNPSTSISFSLKNDGFTSLKIYNMLGQEITSLVNENLTSGTYSYTFNASGLPSGTYFYRLTSGSYTELKKMILVK